jgi:hypothetical protein
MERDLLLQQCWAREVPLDLWCVPRWRNGLGYWNLDVSQPGEERAGTRTEEVNGLDAPGRGKRLCAAEKPVTDPEPSVLWIREERTKECVRQIDLESDPCDEVASREVVGGGLEAVGAVLDRAGEGAADARKSESASPRTRTHEAPRP